MRIDKFLKVSHLIKRREVAKMILDHGLVLLNGRLAKPATEVKVNDDMKICIPNRLALHIRVLELREFCPLDEVESLYEVIEEN